MDCVIQFRNALQGTFGPLDWLSEPDGAIHRLHVPGDKPGTLNGWYLLNNADRPAGCFGSWHGSGMFMDGAGCLFSGRKYG